MGAFVNNPAGPFAFRANRLGGHFSLLSVRLNRNSGTLDLRRRKTQLHCREPLLLHWAGLVLGHGFVPLGRNLRWRQSGSFSCLGSGSQKLATKPTAYTSSPTAPAAYANFAAAVVPGIDLANCVVSSAAEVPIMRPPIFAAKLSPVPRRWVGYTRGR